MKGQTEMKNKAGFTLIELMIVVAIIAIIASIAIPNLIRSRQTADEGAAIGAMRTISTAEGSHRYGSGEEIGRAIEEMADQEAIARIAAITHPVVGRAAVQLSRGALREPAPPRQQSPRQPQRERRWIAGRPPHRFP